MSKRVQLKNDTLIVYTREDYERAKKVIFTHKDKTGKTFYQTDSRYINDLEQIESWTICGYLVEDIIRLAHYLKEVNLKSEDLKDYNRAFEYGYDKGMRDLKQAISHAISEVMKDI